MKIILKELRLRNFKGAKDQTIDFSEDTEIMGANATGKTRIFDAFNYLLFGKDSEDRKDFSVKTLDRNNQPLHHADHTVTATLAIDGMDHTFERTLREKWVKKRGEETPEFDGNETLYFVNGVPHKQGEYQQKIEAIIPEDLFKLLTNPFYFNQTMGWTQRRELLFKLTGGVTDQDLGERYPELKEFMTSLQNKSLDDFRKEVGFKKKQLKQIIAGIPARMDEVQRSMQPEADYAKAEKEIARLEKEDRKIDEQLQNETEKNAARDRTALDLQREIFSLQQNILETRHRDQAEAEKKVNEARLKASALNLENATHEQNIAAAERMIAAADNRAKALAKENDSLREQWREANQAVIKFDEEEFCCPTCHRPFEAGDIEQKKAILVENFNRSKADRLRILTETGKANKLEIDLLLKDIEKWSHNAKTSHESIAINNTALGKIIIPDDYTVKPNPQIPKLEAQIKQKEQQLAAATDGKSNAELINQRKEISAAVDIQRAILLTREINQQHTDRLEQLHKEQKDLSQQLAGLEREEYLGEKLTRARVTLMEEKVNSLFTMVRFKMFSQQVNGGLGETCEALVNGIPFNDVNGAGKIQAGLDIIKTLSKHYNNYAPVFIDNRESCTKIPKMECQVISLIVDPKAKELKIIHN